MHYISKISLGKLFRVTLEVIIIFCFVINSLFFQIDAQLLEYKPQVEEVTENGVKQSLETSALGLTFRVRKNHVGVGLKLECTASIGSVYWQSFQEKIPVSPREQPVSGNWWTGSSSGPTTSTHFGNYYGIWELVFLHLYNYFIIFSIISCQVLYNILRWICHITKTLQVSFTMLHI